MEKSDKAMVILRQVFGWIWTALLAVEGWFAWIYVNAGISLMVEDLPDKIGDWYFNPIGFMYILFPLPFVVFTAWMGKRLTGVSAGKYAAVAFAVIALGVAAQLLRIYVIKIW